MISFSVCMSVYYKDKPSYLSASIRSVWRQTIRPNEIILVVDGPIPFETDSAINTLREEIAALRVIRLSENNGHAVARQTGLEAAKNNLCAVMDSDDIAIPERFEKQLAAFAGHPDVSVVGGLIKEFVDTPENVVGRRVVPETDSDIKKYMKSRCPMNLVTVMLKKDDVMAVGGFLDWYCEEDYYLWLRMSRAGYGFYNIQENLVNVRVGNEMYQRRGGRKYFASETRLQKYMLQNKIINYPRFFYNVFVRFILQVVMPNKVRGWAFKTFARQ